jgi:hypothetical protein
MTPLTFDAASATWPLMTHTITTRNPSSFPAGPQAEEEEVLDGYPSPIISLF